MKSSYHFVFSHSVLLCPNLYSTASSLSLVLRPTVSRPVCIRIKHPYRTYDQIFVTVRQLRVFWCGALSLTRGRVCRSHSLLAPASTVILGSESRGTRYHVLLSQIRGFPFRRLLRLARLRWRYSTQPPHGRTASSKSESHCDWRSVSQSWCRTPSWAHDQIFITVWQSRSCLYAAPSLTRGRIYLLSESLSAVISHLS
jgi:hypothetical protein